MNLAKGMVAKTGSHWFFLQIRVPGRARGGKIDEAIKTYYTEVLDKIESFKDFKPDEKESAGRRFAPLAVCTSRTRDRQGGQTAQRCSSAQPDAYLTNKNDLGFIWCDNDMKLDESEKLIRRSPRT